MHRAPAPRSAPWSPPPPPPTHRGQAGDVLRVLLQQDVSGILIFNTNSVRTSNQSHLHNLSVVWMSHSTLAAAPVKLGPPLSPGRSATQKIWISNVLFTHSFFFLPCRTFSLLVSTKGWSSLQSLHQAVHDTLLISWKKFIGDGMKIHLHNSFLLPSLLKSTRAFFLATLSALSCKVDNTLKLSQKNNMPS